MKKIILFATFFLINFNIVFSQATINKKNTVEKEQVLSKNSKPPKAIVALRKKHTGFLKKSPFKATKTYSKKESLALGLPPNKYYEENWELSMNPETGRPSVEKLEALRIQLEQEQRNGSLNRTPGDGIDNSWIERGPTNVAGRTRAVMFDPNDPTSETVFAGGVSGGLWKNTSISNPSSVWTRVGIPENLAVSCITSDPNNPQIFYVGTGESYVGGDANGDGVWKSINGGITWNKVFGGISGPTYFNSISNLTVNSPSAIAGSYSMVEAPTGFSSAAKISAPITSNVVFQNDLPANPSNPCIPFPNPGFLSGKIALIRTGNCSFTSKVKAAQNAGAIAVIIMNNNTDLPYPMPGTDPSITIPAVMISKANGDILQNALLSGTVNVTLTASNGTITWNIVPGVQHINAIRVRNNGGISEVYVAVGDTFYSAANIATYMGGTTFGLYKSINNGVDWVPVTLPLTANGTKHAPNDIEIGADNKVWVSTINSRIYGNGGGKVFSSVDGTNFIEKFVVPNGLRTQIAVSKTNPNKIYVLAQLNVSNTIETTFIKTINDFANTTVLAQPINVNTNDPRFDTYGFTGRQAYYDLVLEVDPNNDEKLFTGGIDIFSSVNGGTSWSQTSVWTPVSGSALPVVHADQHAVVFGPGNKLLFGNDGGVYFSNNYGATLSSRNKGFNITQFYSIGVSPTTNGLPGDNFIAGAQDNGSQMFTNAPLGPNTSVEVQGGDGAYSMFDQDGTDRYRIVNYVYNQRIMLGNYTTGTSHYINFENNSNGAFIAPMALDSRLDILYSDYAAGANVRVRRYKNIKNEASIQKAPLTNALLNSAATALTVSPFPPTPASTSTLLIGTRGGRLLKVINADAGTTTAGPAVGWSNITGPGFVGSVSDVEYGLSENEIYVTFHNYNVVSVWYTNDAGVTWQNKEGNLPDLPVKCILRNPLNQDEVIIGTDLGVWASSNFTSSSPTWTRSDNGMQNVRVTDLDLRNDNTVYAATYGRGVFSGLFTGAPLSTTNFKNDLLVNVYPNPSDGQITIKINEYNGKVNLQVVDLNGRVVYSSNDSGFNVEKSINLENLQSGMYILKMNGEGFGYTKKIILK
jgi:hypothetical protein